MFDADKAHLLWTDDGDAETGNRRLPGNVFDGDSDKSGGSGSWSDSDRSEGDRFWTITTLTALGLVALAATAAILGMSAGQGFDNVVHGISAAALGALGHARKNKTGGAVDVQLASQDDDDSEMQLAPPRSATLVAKGDEGSAVALDPTAAELDQHDHASDKAATLPSSHYAADCWKPCGGAGLCEDFCGVGRACCRWGSYGPNQNLTDPPECGGSRAWPVLTYHTCVSAFAPPPEQPPHLDLAKPLAPLPEAPTFKFYLYRAQNDEDKWEFGNVNVANLPGVMWYLNNEVMPRCPKRYGISRLRRYEIMMKSTPELYARGMNFGVRYSYDAGKCTGSNIRWLGPCTNTWDRFGHVLGCNNFRDHYPYPLVDTEYPDGIWYDLPLKGRCDEPTGERNCTWSYRDAGEIRMDALEAMEPGFGYCCENKCTDFWRGHWTPSECDRRLVQVKELFARTFPEMPMDLPPPPCDFDYQKFWA